MATTAAPDWQGVLGIDDPAPGDPDRLQSLANAYGQVGDDAATARDQLKSAQFTAGRGESMDALRDKLGNLPRDVDLLATSYGAARDALGAYVTTLREAQDQAQRAWAQASSAHDDLTTAHQDVQSWTSKRDAAAAANPPDVATHTEASTQVSAAQGRADDAQQGLDAARRLAQDAADLRAGAASTAAAALDEAAGHAIPERSIWQKISDWFHDNPWISWLLVALSIILPFLGPVGVVLGVTAGVVLLGSQVLDMALTGKVDVAGLVLGILSLVPGVLAFTKIPGALGEAFTNIVSKIGSALKPTRGIADETTGLLSGGGRDLTGSIPEGEGASHAIPEPVQISHPDLNTNVPRPDVVFRGDTRGPDEIFNDGFTARGNNYNLDSHVGGPAPDGGYIPTGADKNVSMDFAYNPGRPAAPARGGLPPRDAVPPAPGWLYEIKPTGNMISVPHNAPSAEGEGEWAAIYHIDPKNIVSATQIHPPPEGGIDPVEIPGSTIPNPNYDAGFPGYNPYQDPAAGWSNQTPLGSTTLNPTGAMPGVPA